MVVAVVHLILAIALIFIMPIPMMGVYELIDVLILFCALARMDFCCIIIYLINITLNFFTWLNQLGLLVQTGKFSEVYSSEKSQNQFGASGRTTLVIILEVFYIVATIVCFLAYREFKGMMVDNTGGVAGFGLGRFQQSGPQNAERVAGDRREAAS